jgi:TRL (tRNA-associated locus)-like protein
MRMRTLAGLLVPVLLTGCLTVATPAVGFIYTDVKWPHDATSNAASPKVGTGEACSVLSLVAWGDASIESAAKKAGITKIHHVDYHSKHYVVFGCITVKVYGE